MVSKKGSRLMVRIYRATFMVCPVCQSFQFLPPRFHVKSSSLRLSQSYCERSNCRYLTFPCDLRSRELETGDSRVETSEESQGERTQANEVMAKEKFSNLAKGSECERATQVFGMDSRFLALVLPPLVLLTRKPQASSLNPQASRLETQGLERAPLASSASRGRQQTRFAHPESSWPTEARIIELWLSIKLAIEYLAASIVSRAPLCDS